MGYRLSKTINPSMPDMGEIGIKWDITFTWYWLGVAINLPIYTVVYYSVRVVALPPS